MRKERKIRQTRQKKICTIKSAGCTNKKFYFQKYYRQWAGKDAVICSGCQEHNFKTITKTRAIKELKVNEKLLGTLRCVEEPNPHYKKGAPMKLYLVREVLELKINKCLIYKNKKWKMNLLASKKLQKL